MKQRKNTDWKTELNTIVTENNGASSRRPNAVSSSATQKKRRENLFSAFADLRALGYKIESVRNLRTKHVKALAQHWIKEGQSSSTIQNKISILRVFCGWIGKGDMIPESKELVDGDQVRHVTRSHVATEDKSWSGKEIDFEAKVGEIAESEPYVAMQLELQRAFGLRRRESWMFRPKTDTDGGMLNLFRGTKGGRARIMPVKTECQADVLKRATALAGNGSMMPAEYNLKKWESHYNWVMHREQITRKGMGITSHGLRHEYVHDEYEGRLGVKPPVKGGGMPDMGTDDINAQKHMISEGLGHSRPSIIGCYSGSPKTRVPKKKASLVNMDTGGMAVSASGMETMASVPNEA